MPTISISISEARRRLPELVRRVRKDAAQRFRILVNREVVAEIRSAEPEPEPGAAIRALLAMASRRGSSGAKGRKVAVSSSVKNHLYGHGGAAR